MYVCACTVYLHGVCVSLFLCSGTGRMCRWFPMTLGYLCGLCRFVNQSVTLTWASIKRAIHSPGDYTWFGRNISLLTASVCVFYVCKSTETLHLEGHATPKRPPEEGRASERTHACILLWLVADWWGRRLPSWASWLAYCQQWNKRKSYPSSAHLQMQICLNRMVMHWRQQCFHSGTVLCSVMGHQSDHSSTAVQCGEGWKVTGTMTVHVQLWHFTVELYRGGYMFDLAGWEAVYMDPVYWHHLHW